jgi:hypothetical protein
MAYSKYNYNDLCADLVATLYNPIGKFGGWGRSHEISTCLETVEKEINAIL